ncbi:HAD family hydrolase [Geminocystis sp. NIES-3709]|uniref:HAD family hydrolase n=1 Tax=Geminocystis sp. NIES-3709 TaxID=1617448 RepID=UPI0005FCD342|nr:HAD-IA family hydrolase [Geminocystis sp. NIES-3709]BAQ64571.1 haloacid dehalogenase-like hydrolase [Geminocystis sp. NIES-3709]
MNTNLDLSKIDAIMFDLGGVIIDVDMEAPYKKLLTMSDRNQNDLLKDLRNIAYQYEIGIINDREFISQINHVSGLNLPPIVLENLWNEMLGYVPSYMGDLLAKIQKEKRTFILSNTNPIHIREVKKRFQQAIPNYTFESLFEKIYYSYEINLHKPDLKIFDYVVNNSKLNPSSTLFIDDNKNNIISALNYGLNVIYMNPSMTLPKLFKDY